MDIGQGLVTLGRRKRVMASTNHNVTNVHQSECKRGGEETAMNGTGGTWPRCRGGSPFVAGQSSGDYFPEGANTLFHSYKYPRARLPLSVFIDASKTSKNDQVNDNRSSG